MALVGGASILNGVLGLHLVREGWKLVRPTLLGLLDGADQALLGRRVMSCEIATRLPDLEISGPPEYLRSNFIHGIKRMPCEFKVGGASLAVSAPPAAAASAGAGSSSAAGSGAALKRAETMGQRAKAEPPAGYRAGLMASSPPLGGGPHTLRHDRVGRDTHHGLCARVANAPQNITH